MLFFNGFTTLLDEEDRRRNADATPTQRDNIAITVTITADGAL